jgi:hypothetical protein
MRYGLVSLLLLLLAVSGAGQNLVANGDFELGTTGWTNVRFNDPLGTHGVRLAPVLVGQPSHALYADFQTLTPVMENRYDSDPFLAEAKEYPLSFDCMWEKKVTTPVPSPSVNYIMLIFRAQNSTTTLQSFQVRVPQQTGTEERKSYSGKIKFPAVGNYVVQVFMRHSNLAGMPYFAHVDNIVVGTAGGLLVGGGSPSPGKTVDLFLKSPPDKGRAYIVASSLGTGPIVLGNRKIELTPDDLMVVTVFNYLPSVFVNYQGTLDAQGDGKAEIRIPNIPALINLRIHSAFVVLDAAAPYGIQTISNTFTFTIL